MSATIKIIEYSERSIVVIGDTKEIKDKFKVDGKYLGRFNKFLSIKDDNSEEATKKAGWVFSIKHRQFVENIVNTYLASITPKEVVLSEVFTTSKQEPQEEQEALF